MNDLIKQSEILQSQVNKIYNQQFYTNWGAVLSKLVQTRILANMIPELSDLVDTGIVTKTTALAMMRSRSEEYGDTL